jgi:uncharacterized protein
MAGKPEQLSAPLIIQFAKAPVEGRVKTRMQPELTAGEACELHRQLLRWTFRRLHDSALAAVELWLDQPSSDAAVRACEKRGNLQQRIQPSGDLGEKMYAALCDGLQRYERVILVGSDCPGIDGDYLQQALLALETCDVVIGPATDGGYVLIGARRIESAVFEGVPWGSSAVLESTVARLKACGLAWQALAPLPDIDRPEDLVHWHNRSGS